MVKHFYIIEVNVKLFGKKKKKGEKKSVFRITGKFHYQVSYLNCKLTQSLSFVWSFHSSHHYHHYHHVHHSSRPGKEWKENVQLIGNHHETGKGKERANRKAKNKVYVKVNFTVNKTRKEQKKGKKTRKVGNCFLCFNSKISLLRENFDSRIRTIKSVILNHREEKFWC